MSQAISISSPAGSAIHCGASNSLVLFLGPCVMESRDSVLFHVEAIKKITQAFPFPFVFKASFDKANRTSAKAFRGIGIDEGLKIFQEVRKEFNVPVVSDIHSESDAEAAGSVLDVVQVPAFLCRQTDILLAAGKTGKAILLKKGQFVAPVDMQYAVKKINEHNNNVMLCERGTCFGYRELIVDYRSFSVMSEFAPVVFDATHSVQVMGGAGGSSSGNSAYVPSLVRAAVSYGVSGLFVECHKSPKDSPSDGPNMLSLEQLPKLLKDVAALSALHFES